MIIISTWIIKVKWLTVIFPSIHQTRLSTSLPQSTSLSLPVPIQFSNSLLFCSPFFRWTFFVLVLSFHECEHVMLAQLVLLFSFIHCAKDGRVLLFFMTEWRHTTQQPTFHYPVIPCMGGRLCLCWARVLANCYVFEKGDIYLASN